MADELSINDVHHILGLELLVCIPPIQTSSQELEELFEKGNRMLGHKIEYDLVGTIAFRYAHFSPDDDSIFPETFEEFSTPREKVSRDFNAIFVYSMNVDPIHRGRGRQGYAIGRDLIHSTLDAAKQAGCEYVVLDGRPSSYNGSYQFPQEYPERVPALKAALNRHIGGGNPITVDEMMLEPTLKFYNRVSGGIKPWKVLENFFPADLPAGGHRIICYKELEKL